MKARTRSAFDLQRHSSSGLLLPTRPLGATSPKTLNFHKLYHQMGNECSDMIQWRTFQTQDTADWCLLNHSATEGADHKEVPKAIQVYTDSHIDPRGPEVRTGGTQEIQIGLNELTSVSFPKKELKQRKNSTSNANMFVFVFQTVSLMATTKFCLH